MQIKNSEVKSNTISDNLILRTKINTVSPKIYENNFLVNKRETPIHVTMPERNIIQTRLSQGIRGEKGDKGDIGSGINAEEIQGIPVSSNYPLEDQVLLYDGEKYIPKYHSRQTLITLTESDIYNGYTVINIPASGNSGEKSYIELRPIGLAPQYYGKDFTAINIKNDKIIILWKISGEVIGIDNPVYPTEGMDLLIAGDILEIKYHY